MIISLNLNRRELFVLLAIVNMWQGTGRTLRRLYHCDRWDAQRFHRSMQRRLPAFPTENTDPTVSAISTCSYAVCFSSVIVLIGELFRLRVEDSPLYAFLFNIVLYWFTRTLDGLEFAAVIREELSKTVAFVMNFVVMSVISTLCNKTSGS